MPDWLLEDWSGEDAGFPLEDLLRDSLYYPASGDDGSAVELLGGVVHSFIHSDYRAPVEELEASMRQRVSPNIDDQGFVGYRCLFTRRIEGEHLLPPRLGGRWSHREIGPYSESMYRFREPGYRAGYGDAEGWRYLQLEKIDGYPRYVFSPAPPFVLWGVYERLKSHEEEHGPKRFSILHVCGDGSLTYQALYHRHNIRPLALTVISPGGGNWTNFRDQNLILGRSVLQNPAGAPGYLLADWHEHDSRGGNWPYFNRIVSRTPHTSRTACRGSYTLYQHEE